MKIPLRAQDGSIRAYTLVDPEDFKRFGQNWRLVRGRYAGRTRNRKTLYLHRAILGLEYGDPRESDHINGNKLDNRRRNLRILTRAENKQNLRPYRNNTSGYRGVYWDRFNKAWVANLYINNKHITVGYFKTPELANEAVVAAREELMPFSVG